MEEDKLELNWDDDPADGDDADSPPMSMKFDKKEDNVHKAENDNSKKLSLFAVDSVVPNVIVSL